MFDTQVTVQGWVGSPVTYRETSGGWVASFRLGSTPRTRRDEEWVDGETAWYSVSCWRTLGRNVAESVKLGDAVVVHGRLRADSWQRDGVTATTMVVDAVAVGHDLTRGVSRFAKPTGSSTQGARPEQDGSRSAAAEQPTRPAEPVAAGDGWSVPGGGGTPAAT